MIPLRNWFLGLLTGLGLCIGITMPSPAANSETSGPPANILYIVADDLGFSDLGCYGSEIATPNLDGLAAEGVRLTQFYSMGRCCPSRACLLTGRYPHAVGLGHMTVDIGQPGYRGRLAPGTPTIANVLSDVANYRCFISGKWHLGTEDPTQHGFEEFYGTLVSAKTFFDPDHMTRRPEGRKARTYAEGEFYATDAVTDYALDFLDLAAETPDRPWFLYLAYNAPHFPLQAPPEEIAKYADRYQGGWDKLREERLTRMKELGIVPAATELTPRSPYWNYGETETGTNPAWDTLPQDRRADLARRMAIYAAMVDRMDQQIGRVFEVVRARGQWENTLIVFTSDNGACAEWDPRGFDIVSSNQNILHTGAELEKMGSMGTFHSMGSGWANASNTPWRLYKHFNHEGGIAVPCIVHWPQRLGELTGKVSEEPAHLIDLMATALEAAGTQVSSGGGAPYPGRSLIRQHMGEPEPRPLFFEHEGNRAVREGKWKLVALRDAPWELYDVSADRTELSDVASGNAEEVERLSALWNQWAAGNQVTPLPQDYGVAYLKKGN